MANDPSATLFESPLVQVGLFRCPTSHPRFSEVKPTTDYLFVFPRVPVWIQHDGGAAFVADVTTVPLYNPGRPFRRRMISTQGDRTDWFSVSPALLREALRTRQQRGADQHWRLFTADYARCSTSTFLAQRRVFQHVSGPERPDTLFVEESVVGILDRVLAKLWPEPSVLMRPQHRDLAESARAFIALRYADQDDLSTLAHAIGASVFHLCRVFRQQTGLTVHRYRSHVRLRTSLEMLAETSDDILTIALSLGYSGHSHYTGAFHRAFGLTPSEFRLLSRRCPRRARAIGTMNA